MIATMVTTHEFKARGVCPANGYDDHYDVTMVFTGDAYGTSEVVTIENILRESNRLLASPIFQEDYTRSLAALFLAKVKTVCVHAGNVKTTCGVEG